MKARTTKERRGKAPARKAPAGNSPASRSHAGRAPAGKAQPPTGRSGGSKPDARRVALRVLERVFTDGAFAALALDAELRRATLSERDAALATTLVYGVLRNLPSLDAALAPHLRREPDRWISLVLRMAAFQILYLARVPVYAAVDAAVSIVREERSRGPSGFVNAVLRALGKERPENPELPSSIDLPGWLETALERSLGRGRARAFAEATRLPPPTDLRVTRGSRAELAERLERARPGLQARPMASSPKALRVIGGGDPRRLPGYEQGELAVQELGSQRIVDLVQASSGDRILDACAGRGGKTLALALSADSLELTAADLHEARLERIAQEAERLGIDPSTIQLESIDFSVGAGGLPLHDRVLVDAPCTGLGTVHRRPELLLRLGSEDAARMGELQLAILTNAATLVRPGGLLVYAVCSPLAEEGIEVVDAFEADRPELERIAPVPPASPDEADDDLGLRLGPWLAEPTDAYQVFRWIRR